MANEKRLIDADALYSEIEDEYDLYYGEIVTNPRRFAEMVEEAPTVDAMEVVRCRDCKHWHQHSGKDSGKPVGYGDCGNPCGINGIAYEDSFCSYGERKEGAD